MGKGNKPWEPKHDATLVAGMIELIKAHKKTLYTLPGILGEVDGHGNSRTSVKVDAILKSLVKEWGVDPALVAQGKRKIGKRNINSKETTEEPELASMKEEPRDVKRIKL